MRTRRHFSLWYVGTMGLAAVAMLAGAQPPQVPPPDQGVRQPPPPLLQPPPIDQTTARTTESSVMDEPLRLIAQASKRYQEVTDYTCTLYKMERINGEMQAENKIEMNVKTQPFSVYMKWEKPRAMANQEVCYVVGKNRGMMRVHPHGLGAIAGWVSVDPNDPRVAETSHHKINEAGIGNLIDRTAKCWEHDAKVGMTDAHVADYRFNDRPVTRVETIHTEEGRNQFPYYRTLIYFDKEKQLPVRIENYSWPTRGGNKDGELLEVYNFVDLKLNVGVPDGLFNK
jgi:hypothetical protein